MTLAKLVVKNITRRRGRFVFTLLGITIGIASFVTFLAMGAWHGDGLNWVVYGLFHGCSMALWSLKRWLEDSYAPDFFASLRENTAYIWLCRVFTFNYISFGLLLMLDFKTLALLLAG